MFKKINIKFNWFLTLLRLHVHLSHIPENYLLCFCLVTLIGFLQFRNLITSWLSIYMGLNGLWRIISYMSLVTSILTGSANDAQIYTAECMRRLFFQDLKHSCINSYIFHLISNDLQYIFTFRKKNSENTKCFHSFTCIYLF